MTSRLPLAILLTAALAITALTLAPPVHAKARDDAAGKATAATAADSCKLKVAEFGQGALEVSLGKGVTAVAKLYLDDFFDKRIINANVELTNTTDQHMHAQYYAAFFDRKGKLIGATGQGTFDSGLAPGDSTQLGSCLIPIPHAVADRIASYKITLYQSPTVIGAD